MEERWRIELLGSLRVRYGDGAWLPLPPGKPGALLARLALAHGGAIRSSRPVPREELIELLWPEEEPEAGRHNLRSILYALRRLLVTAGAPADDWLRADRAAVALDPARFSTDVADFHSALAAASAAGTAAARGAALARAVDLYRGELLPGFFEPWVLQEREHLAGRYLEALRGLVQAREESGDLAGALAAAQQAVKADPLREEAHYDLMRLYAATGQPAACVRQFEELEQKLRQELDEAPSAEARALAEELRKRARTLVVARRPAAGGGEGARRQGGEHEQERKARSAGPPPHPLAPSPRLPVQLTRFFGREEEIAQLAEWLIAGAKDPTEEGGRFGGPAPGRLVTVTGPGGSGKTRLAIAMAGRAQQLIGPAVAFVSLGDVADAGRIMEAVADALGLARLPGVAPLEQVAAHLQGRPWLLILDNFEQLVETGAMQVRALLERAETVSCLVTSRVRLDLAAEQELALLPLPTPRSGVQAFRPSGVPDGRGQPGFDLAGPEHLNADHLNALMQFPSVQLFVDRARAARPGFRLTEGNGAAVAELCDRLEGLPLALELAAARAGVLSPEQMLERWEERFQLLVSRQRDVAARHRSLWAAIDSSYQMLTPDLQRFFARLAVFRGGCTLEAAAAVCGVESRVPSGPLDSGSPPMPQAAEGRLPLADPGKTQTSVGHRKPNVQNALENMEQLRACSLVIAEAEGKRAARFRLLEPLREFAWEQLAAAGELAAIRTRHRDWFLQLAEAVGSREFRTQSAGWITQAETEIDNLRAALAWCREQAEADPDGEGAACAVRLILEIPWRLSRHHGDFAEGAQWLADALAKARALPSSLHGRALLMMARYEGWRSGGKLPEALLRAACEQYERALAQARAEKNPIETLQALQSLADIVLKLGDAEAAWAFCLEARQQAEACGDLRELVISLDRMAGVLLARGEFGAARPLLEERLALCRQLQDARLLIHALGAMGHVERHEGDYRRAGALYQESLQLRRGLGYLHAQAQSLEDLASVAALREQADRAARLLGAAEALCHALGARAPAAERSSYERAVDQSRTLLGEAAFAAAWAEGRAMPLDEAVAYALGEE